MSLLDNSILEDTMSYTSNKRFKCYLHENKWIICDVKHHLPPLVILNSREHAKHWVSVLNEMYDEIGIKNLDLKGE